MATYLARRIAQAIATVLAVLTISFFLVRLSGSPGALLLGDNATPDDIAELNSVLGFDQPVAVQFATYLREALGGSLGDSYRQARPAFDVVLERLPATLELALFSFVIGIGLAFVAALVIQLSGARWAQAIVVGLGAARQAVPDFLFAVVLVLLFAVTLGMFPSFGRGGPESMVLPIATLATAQFALYFRLFTASFAEQESQDYVRTAVAKGQSRTRIVLDHMLPNAILPTLTVAGLNLASLLGGTVIIEMVFTWPGMGQVLMNAVSTRDFPVIQAGLVVVALIFVTVNLLVDLLYAALDPRVRLA
ncbi:ABC transporter permease [Demequina silvatica]|uniref:ABC transporter permease n=1 Tax=Demequina silvatica TaxID=1638988 RepID=UPI000786120B|nr:ABC transporter permease [Demequina silvatica]